MPILSRADIQFSSRNATVMALLWVFLFLLLVAVTILSSGGVFSYSLDDAYISLSVAENLLSGSYGINRDEFSSPSSSLIYPFLLAPFLAMGFGIYSALIINFLSALASVWLLSQFFFELIGKPCAEEVYPYVVGFLIINCISPFALPLTGLEHSLHVLLVVFVFRGFFKMTETGNVPLSLIIAVIAMPFVRLEGMALSLASIAGIEMLGHRRSALICSIWIFVGFGIWTVFTKTLHLSFFPSSVLSKQLFLANAVDAGNGSIRAMIAAILLHISVAFTYPVGIIFLGAICFLLFSCWTSVLGLRKTRSATGFLAGVLIFTLSAHIVFGTFGMLYRYEVYAVTILLCGSMIIFRDNLAMICNSGTSDQRMRLLAGLVVVGMTYSVATALTPTAARNTVEQQLQMHRFATDYFPHNVAVNDIGWVSYGNPNFVLDLVGLASDEVRNALFSHHFDSRFIERMTAKKQIAYAMIYDHWFSGQVPKTWCLIAILRSDRLIKSDGDVSFYVLKGSFVREMSEALDRFAGNLPRRVRLIRPKTSCALKFQEAD